MIRIDDKYTYQNVALYIITDISVRNPFITIYYIEQNKLCRVEHAYKHFEIIDLNIWKNFDSIKIKSEKLIYIYDIELFFKWKLEQEVPDDVLKNIIKNNRNKNLNDLINSI